MTKPLTLPGPHHKGLITKQAFVTCMYVFNDRERIDCPKKTINRLKRKIKGKYKYLVFFGKIANPVPMLLQVVNSSSTKQLCMQNCSFFYGLSLFVEEV